MVLVGYDNFLMVSIPQAYGQYCLIKSYVAMNKPEDPVLGHMMHVLMKQKRSDWVTCIPVLSDVCIGLSVLSMLCALTVCIFTCVHLPIGAPGVPPSSPTLLFRRWVRKVESLISQPMTSGKNELQDHLIFISEKALHKRYFSFCQTSWSISWVYGMAYNLFLLNFMVLGDCNSRVSLCPTFSP